MYSKYSSWPVGCQGWDQTGNDKDEELAEAEKEPAVLQPW